MANLSFKSKNLIKPKTLKNENSAMNSSGSLSFNIGGVFQGSTCATENIGVSAFAVNPCRPAYAVYSNGDIGLTGSIINLSDKKFKDNITNISSALDIIEKLEPKQYEYKTRQYAELSMPKGNHYGFIAQEIEAIFA